jgi:ABC-2 type transport system permease protein
MVILFGIPLVQIMLFGFVLNMDISNAEIAVWDKAKDDYSEKLISKIEASDYFTITKRINSINQIEEEFKNGGLKELVIIEQNFTSKLMREKSASVQIINDASDPNMAKLISFYTEAIISDFNQEINELQGKKAMIIPSTIMRNNPEMKSVFMFVPGIITIILMLVSAMMTSISIAREKELGTMEVLLVSPIKPIQIIIGKVTPYVLLSFMNAVIILLLSYFVFQLPFVGSLVLLLFEIILFIIMSLALGIFISTISKTQQIAMMLSMFALLLPTILLSGFVFPIENMPEILQYISHLMPSKWFIIIIKSILIKGGGLSYIWFETSIILLMTIFFIFLSVKKFKIRLE